MKKFGFTLSEILITLGIIGIVAAMTVPTIITKYSTSEYSSRIKKLYGLVSGVFEEAWRTSGVDSVEKLSEEKVKKAAEDTLRVRSTDHLNTKTLNEKRTLNLSQGTTYVLPDGSMFNIYKYNTTYFRLFLDCNGKKGPNVLGRDVFRFVVIGNDPSLTIEDKNKNVGCDPNSSDSSEQAAGSGYGCSMRLLQNGWEIDW